MPVQPVLFGRSTRFVRTAATIWALIAISAVASSGVHAGTPPTSVPGRKHAEAAPNPKIKIVIEKRGTLIAELFPAKAPKTTAHILSLVRRKFYDHLLFHSVVKGFMATTGDPRSKSVNGAKIANLSELQVIDKYGLGSGGSGKTVPLEPGLSHIRGTLGLQRSIRNIDSGDSMFFINLQDNFTNNSAYCVFGMVIEGLNVLNTISQGDRISSITVLPTPRPAYLGPDTKR